jgi:hypothetical protein
LIPPPYTATEREVKITPSKKKCKGKDGEKLDRPIPPCYLSIINTAGHYTRNYA